MIFRLLLGILYVFLTLFLGYFFSRKYFKIIGLEAIVSGFLIINLITPFVCFLISIIFKSNVNFITVFLSIVPFLIILIKDLSVKEILKINVSKEKLILIVSSIVFFVYLFNYSGPFLGYWDTYIAAPAIIMTGNEVDFMDIEGNSLYEYELENKIPNDLINKDAYGIISKDQRIGSGILMSIPFLFFRLFGFRLYYSFYAMCGFILFCFILRKFVKSKDGIFISLFLFLNAYILSINTLNPNVFGIIVLVLMMFLILNKKTNWFIIGLIYGIFGGLRNVAVFFSFGIFFYLMTQKNFIKNTIFFSLTSFIGVLPVLIWNNHAFGNILIHSSQYSFFEGFRPEFLHNFFNLEFMFNGLLNYPIHEQVIRTPHYAFPVLLYLFLLLNKILGLFFVFVFFGFSWFFKKNRKQAVFVTLLLIPLLLFLSFQENWEVAKTTFILLCLPQIFILIAFGLEQFIKDWFKLKYLFKFTLAIICIFIITHIILPNNYAIDERWYERFPKAAQDSYYDYPEKIYQDEFMFFQTRETQNEINNKKEVLKNNLIPYFNVNEFNKFNLLDELSDNQIQALAIWRYIYVDLDK